MIEVFRDCRFLSCLGGNTANQIDFMRDFIEENADMPQAILTAICLVAEARGTPYQTMINRMLRKMAIDKKAVDESRIEKIERELAILKKKIA